MKITVIEINAEELRSNRRVADTLSDVLNGVCESLFRTSPKGEYQYVEVEEKEEDND